MDTFRIKVKMGELEVELEGPEDTVKEELKNLREKGLGVFADSATKKNTTKKNSSKSKKTTKKKSNNKKKTTKSSSSSSTPKLVDDLNLRPDKKESLYDFFAKYDVKAGNLEKTLLFAYYLQQILKVKTITMDHVYTCYFRLNEKIPGNLYQNIIDIKNNKGWLKFDSTDDIMVSIGGLNHVKHDAVKKSAE